MYHQGPGRTKEKKRASYATSKARERNTDMKKVLIPSPESKAPHLFNACCCRGNATVVVVVVLPARSITGGVVAEKCCVFFDLDDVSSDFGVLLLLDLDDAGAAGAVDALAVRALAFCGRRGLNTQ